MVTFPGQLPGLRGTTNSNSPVFSAIDLQRRSQELLSYSISDNTRKLYDTALNVFKAVCFNIFRKAYYHEEKCPPHSHELVNFVSYLSYKQFSPNTIKSYISGLYFCKLHNVHDSTQSFLLRKVLVGLTRKNPRADDRKPLTLDILSSILRLLPTICKSPYESALFSVIFTTAFFGYFRMGELVQNSVHDPGHAIQARDVIYLEHNNTVPIFLRHSKTDQNIHIVGPKRIWIIGLSIIKHAFCYARTSSYGANLELARHNATIFWQGKGGMRLEEIYPKVRRLLKVEDAPHILVIHCGGNNIPMDKGAKSADLRFRLKAVLKKLTALLPSTILIWSQILPRLH
ncbi:uncharacterized protein LOC130050703 [Ostrea edulis]|uniref:uncharacterized protein LOC130050703 n=1 Tax=Ostrea edulis TaxID=37623 RepID=UPI0024AFD171|nr:uncharacterized protein LOC130050703 [Ostrea edulis]